MEESTRYVTVEVHKEFADRIDERDKMQNSRIDALEQGLKEVNKITLSVERLAANIETMTVEIKKQGQRLDEIEKRPAKRWDAVVTGIIGAVVGALGAAIMTGVLH